MMVRKSFARMTKIIGATSHERMSAAAKTRAVTVPNPTLRAIAHKSGDSIVPFGLAQFSPRATSQKMQHHREKHRDEECHNQMRPLSFGTLHKARHCHGRFLLTRV
jgi:hypothetical protein